MSEVRGRREGRPGLFALLVVLSVFAGLEALVITGVINSYIHTIICYGGVVAISALGLNLVYGYTGQFSLGHAAFYGLGAYCSALVTRQLRVPGASSLAAGILIASVLVGLLVLAAGLSIVRLPRRGRGARLALAIASVAGFAATAVLLLLASRPRSGTGTPDVRSRAPNVPAECSYVVYFGAGGYALSPEGESTLAAATRAAASLQDVRLEVVGHTDATGDADMNMMLGRARANSVRASLVRLGVESTLVSALSQGEQRPVSTRAAEYWRDRRADVRVSGTGRPSAVAAVATVAEPRVRRMMVFIGFGSALVLGIVAAALLAGLVAFLIGLPILRLKSDYLGIATLGFGMIVNVLLKNSDKVIPVMGGSCGMRGIARLASLPWVFGLLVVAVVVLRNLVYSSVGRALVSVREDALAAETVGINTTKYKTTGFVLGCMYAGVAGALYAHLYSYLSPDNFDFLKSIDVLLVVVLGGLGSMSGTVVAALAWVALLEGLRIVLPPSVQDWRMVFYPFLLIVFMLARPGGIFAGTEFGFLRPRSRREV